MKIGKHYGFIDKSGRVVIEPKYDYALAFTEGLSPVSIDDDFVIIDKKGNVVVTLDGEEFSDVSCF